MYLEKKSIATILKQGGDGDHASLNKVLNVRDLTFLGLLQLLEEELLVL